MIFFNNSELSHNVNYPIIRSSEKMKQNEVLAHVDARSKQNKAQIKEGLCQTNSWKENLNPSMSFILLRTCLKNWIRLQQSTMMCLEGRKYPCMKHQGRGHLNEEKRSRMCKNFHSTILSFLLIQMIPKN